MDPTKKELYTAKRSSGLDTSSDPNVETAIIDIKSGIICCYSYDVLYLIL